MKNYKTLLSILLFFLIGIQGIQGQEAILVSGGDASGLGGNLSFSVGQVVYTTETNTSGSVAQGVQQPNIEEPNVPPPIPLADWSIYIVFILIGISIWLQSKKESFILKTKKS